jgi:hypothetical protein
MSRNKGTFNFAANFEVLTKAPLDARLVVSTKADLINPTVWQDINSNIWIYKGITVSVTSDPNPSLNGLYFLIDEALYTDYTSWVKLNMYSSDASGTSWATWQINDDENGVILRDNAGNLEIVTFDGNTFASLTAANVSASSIKIDSLTGALYAQDGSVFAIGGSKPLFGYEGFVIGNAAMTSYNIVHDLSTMRQTFSVWDRSTGESIYPDVIRGASTNVVNFHTPPASGQNYDIIILGF